MPGNPFRPVSSGQRVQGFPRELWNGLIGELRGYAPETGDAVRELTASQTWAFVRNDSGADLGEFGILGLGEPLILPATSVEQFKRRLAFKGELPGSTHVGKFAVLMQPLATGAIGRAVISGVWQVVVTGAAADFAEIVAGDTERLHCSSSGSARVLWAESGSGERRAVVRLGETAGAVKLRGTLTSVLAASGSATMTVAVTGVELTVYDWLLSSGQTIEAGKQVTVFLDASDGRYYVDAAQCA
jgi:hypothetical protein